MIAITIVDFSPKKVRIHTFMNLDDIKENAYSYLEEEYHTQETPTDALPVGSRLLAFMGSSLLAGKLAIAQKDYEKAHRDTYAAMKNADTFEDWVKLDKEPMPQTGEAFVAGNGSKLIWMDVCTFPFSIKNHGLSIPIPSSLNLALCRTISEIKVNPHA